MNELLTWVLFGLAIWCFMQLAWTHDGVWAGLMFVSLAAIAVVADKERER